MKTAKITTNQQLEDLIKECRKTALAHGYKDMLNLPLEWRPITGMHLLTDLATGYAIWPHGPRITANAFIEAYGAYYDAQERVKYTAAALQALRTVTR